MFASCQHSCVMIPCGALITGQCPTEAPAAPWRAALPLAHGLRESAGRPVLSSLLVQHPGELHILRGEQHLL